MLSCLWLGFVVYVGCIFSSITVNDRPMGSHSLACSNFLPYRTMNTVAAVHTQTAWILFVLVLFKYFCFCFRCSSIPQLVSMPLFFAPMSCSMCTLDQDQLGELLPYQMKVKSLWFWFFCSCMHACMSVCLCAWLRVEAN